MKLRHLLVTTNNFWVGGRESFLASYLRELAGAGVTADLICSELQPDLPEARIFRRVFACGAGSWSQRLPAWMEQGAKAIEDATPDALWGQHSDLLPAWLLARRHGLPLLATFHAPLLGVGRPNDLLEALGMILAIRHGDGVAGVSPEVARDLRELGPRGSVYVLPNTIERAKEPARRLRWPPRRLLLVTRPEKLGHLRAAVRLFAAYRQLVPGARLSVAAGQSPRDTVRSSGALSRVRRGLEVLGARWCQAEGGFLWRALPAIDWLGYAPDGRELARSHDLVLGMGRVCLEGLAADRPTVLVGYSDAHGLLESQTWHAFADSNFSGRGCAVVAPGELARVLAGPAPGLPDLGPVDVRVGVDALQRAVANLERRSPGELLSRTLLTRLAATVGEDELFAAAAEHLENQDWRALYRVAKG